jgi:hypothetical protein
MPRREAVSRAVIDAPYLRTLRRAAQIVGGEAALAAAWNIPPETLRSWLAGEIVLPIDFYMAALEIVQRSSGPA